MKKNFLKKAVPVVLAMSMAIPVAVFAESSADVDAVTHETEKNIMETVAAGNTEETTPGVDVEETTTTGTDDAEETTTVTEAGTDDVTDNKTDSSTDKTEETSKETETTAKEEETTADKKETATIHIEYVDEEGVPVYVYLDDLGHEFGGTVKKCDITVNAGENYDLSKYAKTRIGYILETVPDGLKGTDLKAGEKKTVKVIYKRQMTKLTVHFADEDGKVLETKNITIPSYWGYLSQNDKRVSSIWTDFIDASQLTYTGCKRYESTFSNKYDPLLMFDINGSISYIGWGEFSYHGGGPLDSKIEVTALGFSKKSTSSDSTTKPEKSTTTKDEMDSQKETVTKNTVKSANDKTAVTTASTETATANQTAGTNNNPKTGVPFPVYPVAGGLLAGVAAFFARKKK